MRWIAKTTIKWMLVLLPFGWFLLACWLGSNATLGSLLMAAAPGQPGTRARASAKAQKPECWKRDMVLNTPQWRI